jgi:hypothetical protein
MPIIKALLKLNGLKSTTLMKRADEFDFYWLKGTTKREKIYKVFQGLYKTVFLCLLYIW